MEQDQLDRLVEIISERIAIALAAKLSEMSTVTPDSSGDFRIDERLITEGVIMKAAQPAYRRIVIQPGAIITPLAQDYLSAHGIEVIRKPVDVSSPQHPNSAGGGNLVGLLAGNCTETCQQIVKNALAGQGLALSPVGLRHRTPSEFERGFLELTSEISTRKLKAGIVIDDAVFAMKVRAEKMQNIKPAMSWEFTRDNSANLQSSNLLLINNRLLGFKKLENVVNIWLSALTADKKA